MDTSGLIDNDSDTTDIFNANNNYHQHHDINDGGSSHDDIYNSKYSNKRIRGGHEDEFEIDPIVSFDSSADNNKGYDWHYNATSATYAFTSIVS